MSTTSIESVVIGAGVTGLAVARALARTGRDVLVIERAGTIGTETSSRNSEVIHAGIYYPTGSLKARLCVEGRKALYAYCEERGIDHRRPGKLIVASEEDEVPGLRALLHLGRANGVSDLAWLDENEVRDLEPALRAIAALYSPSTGIFDSHAYMLSLHGDAERAGATIAFRTDVTGGEVTGHGIMIETAGRDGALTLQCRELVNAAGLDANALARGIKGLAPDHVPALRYAKGSYFSLQGRVPFRHLIYPSPDQGGLGVHLTLDLAGEARFGPDVQWIDERDYTVDPGLIPAFYDSIRRYWPDIPDGALSPAYAGIRPKLNAPDEPPADFVISGPDDHGVPGLINLFGIESPGLTASLAIAQATLNCLDTGDPLGSRGFS